MAVLFVLYIPIETAEEAESVVSEDHVTSDSENDVSNTPRFRDSLRKSISNPLVGGGVSDAVKSVVDCNVQECDSASSELAKKGCAMGDVVIPGVCECCECDIKPTDGLLDVLQGEADDVASVFYDDAPRENEACDASRTEDGNTLFEQDTEEGEQREGEEREDEHSMATEDGIVYTTECVTLEQVGRPTDIIFRTLVSLL